MWGISFETIQCPLVRWWSIPVASAVLGDVQPADTACASRLVGKADKKVTRVLLIQTYEKCYKGNKVGMVGWVG